ncbi:MAG: hypothetical protein L0J96_08485 [Lactococcus lactis]|nr:hypothetical protein [Alkalibacterium sp.]MDN6389701.1 hypothetical protein [Lactococcus lactis]MDN6389704.1 hypothetical protein [Lactococcus lactis]
MARKQRNHIITQDMIDTNPIPSHLTPSQFIEEYWKIYQDSYKSNNSMNGIILENLIIIALAREGIDNIYYQTELAFVPTALFDAFLYHDEKPVALSIKVSLRERWKQADLEAAALKQVHKKAECYLLSINESETRVRQHQSDSYAGLDNFVLVTSTEFDDLIEHLKTRDFTVAGSIPVITSDDKIYTDELLKENFNFEMD